MCICTAVFSLSFSRYVGEGHPAKRNYYRWRLGEARLTSLYCGGEVSLVCSDQTNIYCGLKGGVILVFLADTLLYVTRLEEKESQLWQLQAGSSSYLTHEADLQALARLVLVSWWPSLSSLLFSGTNITGQWPPDSSTGARDSPTST